VCCHKEKPELHHLRLQLALAAQQLHVWPYPGKIGLREHSASTERSELHVFDHWCHLGTVRDDAELEHTLSADSTLAFDLDTYRLLLKYLAKPSLSRSGSLQLVMLPGSQGRVG
jgi:DNA polymerase III subunit epsilon